MDPITIGHYYLDASGDVVYIAADIAYPGHNLQHPLLGWQLTEGGHRLTSDQPPVHRWYNAAGNRSLPYSKYQLVRDLGIEIVWGESGCPILKEDKPEQEVSQYLPPPSIPEKWYALDPDDPTRPAFLYQAGDRVWYKRSSDVPVGLKPFEWCDIPYYFIGMEPDLSTVVPIRWMPHCIPLTVDHLPPGLDQHGWDILPITAKFRPGDIRYQVGTPSQFDWRPGPKNLIDPLYGETLAEAQKRLPKLGILAFARRRPIPTCDLRDVRAVDVFTGAQSQCLQQRFILSDGTDMWRIPPSSEEFPVRASTD